MGIYRIFLIALAALLILGSRALAADAKQPPSVPLEPERVLKFSSEIQVHPDASMSVTETIVVQAEGYRIKRGIIREFPTTYKGAEGNRVTVGFRLREVRRDGVPEMHSESPMENGVSIRIGNPGIFLEPGEHTYTIMYDTSRQLGFFEGYDELYWNVTGNGWEMPIDRAEAVVSLPPGIAAGRIQTTAYTGAYGTRGTGFTSSTGESRAQFATTNALPPYQGLTVVVQWPAGHVTRPSAAARAIYWLERRLVRILSLLGVLAVLLYFWLAWRRVGADPPGGFIMPVDTPPNWLSPAALRYIIHRGYDSKGFTAAVVDLGVKGALRIDEDVLAQYTLTKLEQPPADLPPDEAALLETLFRNGDKLELKQDNYLAVLEAQTTLRSSLARQVENIYYRRNLPDLLRGIWLSLGIIVLMGVAAIAVGGPFPLGVIAATVLYLLAITILFALLIPTYTTIGRGVLDGIEGFKLALAGGQDEYGEEHPGSRVLVEKYLPYAIALEVHNQWSARFEKALSQQAAAGGTPGGTPQPQAARMSYIPHWFFYDEDIHGPHSRRGESFSSFTAHFTSALGRNVSAASVPPGTASGGSGGSWGSSSGGSSGSSGSSGSGSSGGGYSGGGGGGGGGKGW